VTPTRIETPRTLGAHVTRLICRPLRGAALVGRLRLLGGNGPRACDCACLAELCRSGECCLFVATPIELVGGAARTSSVASGDAWCLSPMEPPATAPSAKTSPASKIVRVRGRSNLGTGCGGTGSAAASYKGRRKPDNEAERLGCVACSGRSGSCCRACSASEGSISTSSGLIGPSAAPRDCSALTAIGQVLQSHRRIPETCNCGRRPRSKTKALCKDFVPSKSRQAGVGRSLL
jgi:hypothetical protein